MKFQLSIFSKKFLLSLAGVINQFCVEKEVGRTVKWKEQQLRFSDFLFPDVLFPTLPWIHLGYNFIFLSITGVLVIVCCVTNYPSLVP